MDAAADDDGPRHVPCRPSVQRQHVHRRPKLTSSRDIWRPGLWLPSLVKVELSQGSSSRNAEARMPTIRNQQSGIAAFCGNFNKFRKSPRRCQCEPPLPVPRGPARPGPRRSSANSHRLIESVFRVRPADRPGIVGLRVQNSTERFFVRLASSAVVHPKFNVIAYDGREIRRTTGGSTTMLDTASAYLASPRNNIAFRPRTGRVSLYRQHSQ
jgi:hypothetical protein